MLFRLLNGRATGKTKQSLFSVSCNRFNQLATLENFEFFYGINVRKIGFF